MSSLDLRLYEKIYEGLVDLLDRKYREVAGGYATSWEDYRYRIGYLEGLNDAITIAKEAQQDILGVDKKEER